ncbi:MAG: alpha-glucan family phosphorylase [Desulfovibrionaceae bacterium]|nr:alpha-glucan family phosphorylase [Desulfovibrionaceae bacterium]
MEFNNAPVSLFEVSWEVCNKVGGIYSVVSSKALKTRDVFKDNYIVFGPLLQNNSGFEETSEPVWDRIRPALAEKEIVASLGRWDIPGKPLAVLVDFSKRYDSNQLLYDLWKNFGVDSLSGAWDYIEPVMFSTLCGEVISIIHKQIIEPKEGRSVALFHEWMCGAGLLYLKKNAPDVATVFTTHATMLGRAMAGEGSDIYSTLRSINPANEAASHNITAKWSMESTSAREADSFTTVSNITGEESAAFLGRQPTVITTNGLDMRVIPDFSVDRHVALDRRAKVLSLCRHFLRGNLPENPRIILISGRYEYHNKGVDIFLEALAKANINLSGSHENYILALCLVMGGHTGVNEFAISGNPQANDNGLPFLCTHHAWNAPNDPILNNCRRLGLNNMPEDHVKVIFNPAMLDGNDGFFNMSYEDVLSACDAGIFPSWYEPWGYTPQECAACAVPTVTTDLSGFGIWAKQKMQEEGLEGRGVHILPRRGRSFDESVQALQQVVLDIATCSMEDMRQWRTNARRLAEKTDWNLFYDCYYQAFYTALTRADNRVDRPQTTREELNRVLTASSSATPFLRSILAVAEIPKALSRLRDLSRNLWWCWNNKAKTLFSDLNPQTWELTHNPIEVLEETDPKRLKYLSQNKEYMQMYNEVIAAFDNYMAEPLRAQSELVTPQHPIAYFSTEYGLNESVPIYSGGLGVLSGDHLKSASDLAIPLVGIGLLYRKGYFKQRLDLSGRQVADYPVNKFAHLPIKPLLDDAGDPILIQIDLPGRALYARIWKIQVGRISLYLLDSNVDKNRQEDREITANLYVGDRETRLLQEMLLGMGGIRLLKTLGIEPHVFHMNEGHSALLVFERLLQFMSLGMTYAEAKNRVCADTLFTTHTPVAAGNEAFAVELMQRYFESTAQRLGLSWQQFVQLGQMEGSNPQNFELTILALRFSLWSNGVSRLHGEVARHMWNKLWKNLPLSEIPIYHVTNGVHTQSYVGMQMEEILNQYLGPEWVTAGPDDPVWKKVDNIPIEDYWAARMTQKEELLSFMRDNLIDFALKFNLSSKQIKAMERLLHPNTLIIGFARRFAPYKRATLLFADPERLARILDDPNRPVCFVFAGKAHPADEAGNDLIQRVVEACTDPKFIGKIFFIEDYNLRISRLLSQGCDVWLNTPRRPYEASGTSGMKLPVNGGINLSISDGWWCEGYNRNNGWTIGPVVKLELPKDSQNDYADAESLYNLLERDVIPLYHELDENNLQSRWIRMSKNSMKSLTAMYSSSRMLRDYCKQGYLPAAARRARLEANDWQLLREVTKWEESLPSRFRTVSMDKIEIKGADGNTMLCGEPISINLHLHLGEMRSDEIQAQLVIGLVHGNGNFITPPTVLPLEGHIAHNDADGMDFHITYTPTANGHYSYGIRIVPVHPGLSSYLETGLMIWA